MATRPAGFRGIVCCRFGTFDVQVGRDAKRAPGAVAERSRYLWRLRFVVRGQHFPVLVGHVVQVRVRRVKAGAAALRTALQMAEGDARQPQGRPQLLGTQKPLVVHPGLRPDSQSWRFTPRAQRTNRRSLWKKYTNSQSLQFTPKRR